MSHVPVETVEEDAADLQFPKGRFEYVSILGRFQFWAHSSLLRAVLSP